MAHTNADYFRIAGSVPTRTDVAGDMALLRLVEFVLGSCASSGIDPATHQALLIEFARAIGFSADWTPNPVHQHEE